MADTVQYLMEEMIPELEMLAKAKVFSKLEIKGIVKRRRKFEYRLKRRHPSLTDFLAYIDFEVKLSQLRELRQRQGGVDQEEESSEDDDDDDDEDDEDEVNGIGRDRRRKKGKKKRRKKFKSLPPIAQFASVRRIHFIFQRALKFYRDDVQLWIQYLHYCRSTDSRVQLSRGFARALQLHAREPSLWLMAASWEFSDQENAPGARILLQRALRVNKESAKLWLEYFRVELLIWKRALLKKLIDSLEKSAADEAGVAVSDGAKKLEEKVGGVAPSDEETNDGRFLAGEAALIVARAACQSLRLAEQVIPMLAICEEVDSAAEQDAQLALHVAEGRAPEAVGAPCLASIHSSLLNIIEERFSSQAAWWHGRAQSMLSENSPATSTEAARQTYLKALQQEDTCAEPIKLVEYWLSFEFDLQQQGIVSSMVTEEQEANQRKQLVRLVLRQFRRLISSSLLATELACRLLLNVSTELKDEAVSLCDEVLKAFERGSKRLKHYQSSKSPGESHAELERLQLFRLKVGGRDFFLTVSDGESALKPSPILLCTMLLEDLSDERSATDEVAALWQRLVAELALHPIDDTIIAFLMSILERISSLVPLNPHQCQQLLVRFCTECNARFRLPAPVALKATELLMKIDAENESSGDDRSKVDDEDNDNEDQMSPFFAKKKRVRDASATTIVFPMSSSSSSNHGNLSNDCISWVNGIFDQALRSWSDCDELWFAVARFHKRHSSPKQFSNTLWKAQLALNKDITDKI